MWTVHVVIWNLDSSWKITWLWQNFVPCSCRTEVSVSLLAVSQRLLSAPLKAIFKESPLFGIFLMSQISLNENFFFRKSLFNPSPGQVRPTQENLLPPSLPLIPGPHYAACRILVPQPGTELQAPALRALTPNHWITRKFPISLS